MDGEKSECGRANAAGSADNTHEGGKSAPCDQSPITSPRQNPRTPTPSETSPAPAIKTENQPMEVSTSISGVPESSLDGSHVMQPVPEALCSHNDPPNTPSDGSAMDVDLTPISQSISTTCVVGSAGLEAQQTLTSDSLLLRANVSQSPLPKTTPWNSKGTAIPAPPGALRAKYIVGIPDEGPTVRQHLQQQQLVQRQKLQHQISQQKITTVSGEAAGQALTNSLIQPGPAVRIINPTVRMQLASAVSSSPPRMRPVLQIPAASMSAPPPRIDSPSWNNTGIKQEYGDERPDSVASEGSAPRMTEDIQPKSECQWTTQIQSAPAFVSGVNGSDISMLVKPGPSSMVSELGAQPAQIQGGEHSLLQSVAHIQSGGPHSAPLSSGLPTSFIIQSVPRLNTPSSLSSVLSTVTTNSMLSGPICALMNGQTKFVQRIPRVVAPPQVRDEKHYIKKIAFMKRTIRSLVFKNGALCDEVARLNQRIQTVTEERKLLCKRLQHHERNRIRRLQTQLRKADALNAKAAAKELEPKQDQPEFYGELLAKAAAEAQRMLNEDSAEDSERTLSPSPAPSSMSPTPTDEQMMIEDSPVSYPYSEANSKENGMDYESVESSPRQCSSPSSSGRKTLPTSPVDRQQSRASQIDVSTPPSVNETSPPPETDAADDENPSENEAVGKSSKTGKPEKRTATLRRSARHSNASTTVFNEDDSEDSPSTSERQ